MGKSRKFVAAAFALLILLSALAAPVEAARRYGPGGLGGNLHRRHILRQASKKQVRGQAVTGRAIIWKTRPASSLYRSVPAYRRW